MKRRTFCAIKRNKPEIKEGEWVMLDSAFDKSKWQRHSFCICAHYYPNQNNPVCTRKGDRYLVRMLTPREAFRLMGVRDDDIDKILKAGISKSQMYKMAGNSIVTNCMTGIFKNLFKK